MLRTNGTTCLIFMHHARPGQTYTAFEEPMMASFQWLTDNDNPDEWTHAITCSNGDQATKPDLEAATRYARAKNRRGHAAVIRRGSSWRKFEGGYCVDGNF